MKKIRFSSKIDGNERYSGYPSKVAMGSVSERKIHFRGAMAAVIDRFIRKSLYINTPLITVTLVLIEKLKVFS